MRVTEATFVRFPPAWRALSAAIVLSIVWLTGVQPAKASDAFVDQSGLFKQNSFTTVPATLDVGQHYFVAHVSPPLRSTGASLASPAATDSEVPALVPLAPPLWAGLAMLTFMALIRTRQRRRHRRVRIGRLL